MDSYIESTETEQLEIAYVPSGGEVRTRFPPSPTGLLHVGNARTALFNFLFARKYNGKFILRIEDTDRERSTLGFEQDILDNLRWLGLSWDEGPDVEGPYAPYKQSARGSIYAKYLNKLLEEQKAYYCFCSEEELEAQKQYQMSIGQAPKYSGKCASLTPEVVQKNLQQKKPSIIRFRVPARIVEFTDLIRGKVTFDANLFGDIVIAKDPEQPLYNFAVAVDDYEMKITHVIRGEDHISNTPKQILLQEALNFPTPVYGHLPLILGPDRSKLSKRHGASSVNEYRKMGYLPESLVNFLAFLGWNPGTDKEIYSLQALIKEFSIERIHKGGAVFNIKRFDFLNSFYIRQKPIRELTKLCIPYLIDANLIKALDKKNYLITKTQEKLPLAVIEKIVALHQERLHTLSEITELTDFFYKDKITYDSNLLKWKQMTNLEIQEILERLELLMSSIDIENWSKQHIEELLMLEAEKMGDRGKLLWPLRAALTGKKASAGPFEVAEILGKEKTLQRIRNAKQNLSTD